jgi:hypothetical protein
MTTPNVPPQAPLHPTVLSALANTPVAPLLNQPVEHVLGQMGLPSLPQIPPLPPLPGLPPLPQINPTALFKPITDMFAGFGTGQLGANGAINPQTVLSTVSQGLTTALSLGSAGLSLLSLLQGLGSQAAQDSGTAAAGNGQSLAAQNTQINTGVGAASATIAAGSTQMALTAAQFASTMVALGPSLITPMGQMALLGAGVEAGTQAGAITAETKAQLAVHSAHMAQAGTPVSITAAPSGGSGSVLSDLGQLLNVAQPLISVAQQGFTGLTELATSHAANPANLPKPLGNIDDKFTPAPTAAGLGEAGLPGGGGWSAEAEVDTPLTAYSGEKVGGAADAETAMPIEGETVAAAVDPMSSPMAPMAPMGAGLASIRGAGDMSGTSSHQVLVNAGHGNEVVGDIEGVAPPVVGGADWQSDSPDIALTL